MAKRAAVEKALRNLAPRLPDYEFTAVADHAMDSPGLKPASPETAAWLSLVSYTRHVFTDYDALLADGYDAESARHFVLEELNTALAAWGVRRKISNVDDWSE